MVESITFQMIFYLGKFFNVLVNFLFGFYMLMLGLNAAIDQLAMANSVHWYCHVLRIEDGHVLRRALDFVVQCKR